MKRKRTNKGYTRAPKKKSNVYYSLLFKYKEEKVPDKELARVVYTSHHIGEQELRYLAHTIQNNKFRKNGSAYPLTLKVIRVKIMGLKHTKLLLEVLDELGKEK